MGCRWTDTGICSNWTNNIQPAVPAISAAAVSCSVHTGKKTNKPYKFKKREREEQKKNEHAFRATILRRDWTENGWISKNHAFILWNLVELHFKDNMTPERELVVYSSDA